MPETGASARGAATATVVVRRRTGAVAWLAVTLSASAGAWAQPVAETPRCGPESPMLQRLREASETSAAPRRSPVATLAQAAARDGVTLDAESGVDADFAARVRMPSLPMRVTPRLLETLRLYRTDERARRSLTGFLRNSGRYLSRLQALLVAEGLPEALAWVVAAESNFDPRAASPVGAVGLWQFMPETARGVGLRVDDWVDERRDPVLATRAGARYLRELYERFGSWELSLAAYNMGYAGLLRAVRKYNANDFEVLASLEAGLPLETLNYVPRILGLALAAQNESALGLPSFARETFVAWEDVRVGRSVPVGELARAARVSEAQLRDLNPSLLRSRTPPVEEGAAGFVLHVPQGTGEAVRAALTRLGEADAHAYRLRVGESLEEVAARWGLRPSQLLSRSGLRDGATVRPGSVLLVPRAEPVARVEAAPVVAVDPVMLAMPEVSGARRVYLRVAEPDELSAVARALGVRVADLGAWNRLDPAARVQPGMWLQAFVQGDPSATARVWEAAAVEAVDRTTDVFHDRAVAAAGQRRVRVTVQRGDTFAALAQRYGTTMGMIERVNQRSRRTTLEPGETLLLYADPARVEEADPAAVAQAPAPDSDP
jgi:membrane-bound lytic murein transglycosylase D